MDKFFCRLLLLSMLYGFSSCRDGEESKLNDVVKSFSEAYFNWRFADALPYTDESSRCWLSFAASQVTQEDVDSLRAMSYGAMCRLEEVVVDEGDTTAVAVVHVSGFMALDSIGKPRRVVPDAEYKLCLVLRGSEWKVRLDALPR